MAYKHANLLEHYYKQCVKCMYSGQGNIPLTEYMQIKRYMNFPKVNEWESYYLSPEPYIYRNITDLSIPQLPNSLLFYSSIDHNAVGIDLFYFLNAYTDVNGVRHIAEGTLNQFMRNFIATRESYVSYRDFMIELVRVIGTGHIHFREERMRIYSEEGVETEEVILLHCDFVDKMT